jgi:carbonic anhydrase
MVAAAVLGSAGCEVWKSPDRIHELEGRVDELSAELSAIKGKPVGVGKKDTGGDGHGADPHAPPPTKSEGRKPEAHGAAAKPDAHDDHDDAADDHGRKRSALDLAKEVEKPKPKPPPPHWGYEGKHGPPMWGVLAPEWAACNDGHAQSPIDIEPRGSKVAPIEFDYKPTKATSIDNGHTLQVSFAPGSGIAIEGHRYELVQFHVHTPSEHAIAGERYPLELHLVHKDDAGKLAVVGVLYDTGAAARTLDEVWNKWPAKENVEQKLSRPIDPNTLLPESRNVYRYAGSLTTPPCTEGVVWSVMRRTMTDSKEHLAKLVAHYPNNARPLQPRGDRRVE